MVDHNPRYQCTQNYRETVNRTKGPENNEQFRRKNLFNYFLFETKYEVYSGKLHVHAVIYTIESATTT